MPSGKSIEAGRAFVRVDAELSPLQKKLKQIDAKFKELGDKISGIGSGIAKVGAGVTAIGASITAPIAAAVMQFTAAGDALDKMSARTGVGVEALAEMGFAAEQGGTSIEAVEKGFAKLSQTVYDAGRGLSTATDALGEIGLSYEKLKGLKPEDQFQAVADGLSKITDESKRGAVAQAIFGRSGRQLLPMLSSLREIRQEARDLGLVLGKKDTDAAAKLADAFNRIKRTIGGAFLQVGAAVAEPVLIALDAITKVTAMINKWVAANHALVQQIAAIGVGFVVVGTVVTGVGIALIGLGATIASIGTIASAAFAVVGTAISILTSPITLAVAGIAAIGYVALEASGSLAALSEMFGTLGTTATTAWAGIVAAISSGDFETAGQIAFTALEVAWLIVTQKMQQVWNQVSDFVVNVWLNVVESIVQAGASVYFGIAKYFDQLSVALINGFDTAFVYITGAIDTIQTAIAKAIIKAQEFFWLFSKEQSVQIQATLDEELARRASGREQGLGSRSGQRAADAAGRDAQRQSTAEQFADTVREDFERRRTHSSVDGSGLTDAQKRLQELQAKLAEQSSTAQEKAAKAQEESGKVQQASAAQEQASLAMQTTGAGSVGSFIAGAASQLGGATIQDTIADATKATADNTASMVDQMRELVAGGGLV